MPGGPDAVDDARPDRKTDWPAVRDPPADKPRMLLGSGFCRRPRAKPGTASRRYLFRAVLGYRGYVLEASPDGRMPMLYDYHTLFRCRWPGCRESSLAMAMSSRCSSEDDDHLCLVGPGDEARVEFDAKKAPPLPEGWTRVFVLRAVGYCKDADLFTATGDTVGPLPWRGMTTYPFGPRVSVPLIRPTAITSLYQTRAVALAGDEA